MGQRRPAWLLLGMALAGCGRADKPAMTREVPAAAAPQADESVAAPKAAADRAAPARLPGAPPAQALQASAVEALVASRKLIRTGQLTVEVGSFASAAQAAARIASDHGGYVADSRSSRSDSGRQRGSLVLRIPADRFADALGALKRLGLVKAEQVSSQDVTKAYADLETRLRVKRETLERLRDILRRQTGKLSDVLEVEREIGRVTEEIEQMEGERRYYDQQLALSTLSLELLEPEPLVAGGALAPIADALRSSVEAFASSLGGLIYALSVGLPWALVLWIGWRVAAFVRRRRSR
jgi:hypothetical protein